VAAGAANSVLGAAFLELAVDQLEQHAEVRRLGEVVVEARLAGLELVVFLAPAGDRDQQHVAAAALAHVARDVIPRELRQADVQERHGGLELVRGRDRLGAVVGDAHLVPHHPEQGGEAVGGILVVVDDEDARVRFGGGRRHALRLYSVPRRAGSFTTNSLPFPGPSLNALTVPPCSSTSLRTSVRPMPRPPAVRSPRRSPCVNISKIFSRMPSARPSPSSPTLIVTSSWSIAADSLMWPPGSVYFAALLRRLESTWERRTASASISIGSRGSSTSSSCLPRSIAGRLESTAAATTSCSS